MQSFRKLNRIDEGTYGVVYRACEVETGEARSWRVGGWEGSRGWEVLDVGFDRSSWHLEVLRRCASILAHILAMCLVVLMIRPPNPVPSERARHPSTVIEVVALKQLKLTAVKSEDGFPAASPDRGERGGWLGDNKRRHRPRSG